ncbi:MAG: myo-inosose-2 dehydratase [Spirochaetales bacterium]
MLNKNRVRLGIAPIGWTNDDLPELGGANTFEQCVSEMALAGFSGSEVGNKYPRDPAVLNKALGLRGLTICNAWFSSYLTTKTLKENIGAFLEHRDFLHAVGARVIGASEQGHSIQGQIETPILGRKPVFTDDEWKRLADGLDELGSLAADKGMILTYHHHMGTGVQTVEEIDRLMSSTDASKLSLLFDSGHLTFAGIDPAEVLRKYIHRVRHVHLKDVRTDVLKRVKKENWSFLRAVREGVFTVPGDGSVDYLPILKVLETTEYNGWIVVEAEQDPAIANPLEYAIKARKFLRETTGL